MDKESNSLATIIRMVDARTSGDEHYSHVVIIDCTTRPHKRLDKVSLFLKLKGANIKRFLVLNTNDKRNLATCDGIVCRVSDFEKRLDVDLRIRYRVSCLPENTDKVALSLSEGISPEQALISLVERWVREYIFEREGDFIEHFYEERQKLENHLRRKALDEAGLTMRPVVSLENEGEIKEITLENFHIPVQVRDYDNPLNLMLNLETQINETLKLRAILNKADESQLKELIRAPVQKYLLNTVSLEQFYYELNTTVQKGLLNELVPVIQTKGFDIKKLIVETQDEPPIAKNTETTVEHRFESIVGDQFQGKVEVMVKMCLKFQAQYVVRYVQAEPPCPSLSTWGKNNIEKIFNDIFFQFQYNDLADFEPIKENFASQIKKNAQNIGCDVEIINVFSEFPDLECHDKFEDNIEFSVKVLDHTDDILVKNKIKMTLQNRRRYMEKQGPSLAVWLDESLQNIFRDVLFEVNYSDFVINFKEYDRMVQDKVREESQSIGYKLDRLVIEPQLEYEEILQPIRVTNFLIPVQVYDCDLALNLILHLDTEINETLKRQAILSRMDESQLKEQIQTHVQKYVSETVSLEQFYYELKATVQSGLFNELTSIVQKAGRAIKSLKIDFQDEPALAKHHETTIEHSFEEMVGDQFKGKIKITVRMRLKFQAQYVVRYVQAEPPCPQLSLWGEENIESIFRNIFFHIQYDELYDFTRLKKDFVSQIENAAQEIGCIAEVIRVSHELPDLEGQERFEDEVEVFIKLLGYSQTITVQNKVKMTLQDKRKYMEKFVPSLASWVKEHLQETFNDVLFEVDYLNFVTQFSEYHAPIRDQIREKANNIGYKLEHLIIEPQLEPLTWRDTFSIEVSDKFTTKVGNKVPLKIVVYLSISDLSKVGKYLNTDIKAEIKKTIQEVTESILIQIEPHRFYMRFESDYEGGTPVVVSLKKTIQAKLEDKFAATVESITPQMEKEENDVIHRLDHLISQFGNLDFQVYSVAGPGEKTHFKGRFQVKGVENSREAWDLFIKRKFDMEEIVQAIEDYLISHVNSLPPEALQYKDNDHQIKLKNIMEQLAQECATNSFGLGISLNSIRREQTGLEADMAGVITSEKKAAIEWKDEQIQASKKIIVSQAEKDKGRTKTQNSFEDIQQTEELARLKELQAELRRYIKQGVEDESEIEHLKQAIAEIEQKYQKPQQQSEEQNQHFKQLFNQLESGGEKNTLTGKKQLEGYQNSSSQQRITHEKDDESDSSMSNQEYIPKEDNND